MLYDDQAARYDERAGLPADAVESVADALFGIVGLHGGETLLEIGAGTGIMSLPLLERPIRYIGFDQSEAMLSRFREKLLHRNSAAELHLADGNDRWPVEDRSVSIIFSSRALHHLDAAHVADETRRVVAPGGGWLVLGRVRRPEDTAKSIVRRKMRQLLLEQGVDGRSHENGARALMRELERVGGRIHEPVVAARWTRLRRPAEWIENWQKKSGLASRDVPEDLKSAVLADLRQWAVEQYGDLDREVEQEEYFELTPFAVR
jgi:ubiquinone/menaquinone biosynthesis C-methylase UbiE